VKRALRLYTALLPYRERLLGEDHPDTLVLRNNIAECTAMTGDVEKALELFIALLKVQKRVLGADHPSTLNTRRNLVSWICEGGNVEEAAHLLGPLLSDYERVLELDHPDTLEVLFQLGVYRARSGEQAMGCRMLREGLARTEARFGPAHPLAEKFRDAIRSLGCSGF